MSWGSEARSALVDALPKSAHKHINTILDALGYVDQMSVVEVSGARVGIETIEAYGLEITLDAYGNASTVRSPYGLDVIE